MEIKTLEILGDNRFETYTKTRIGCRAVIIQDDRILLSHETISGWWLVPGGGLEEGETPEEYCYTSHYFVCEVIGEGKMHLMEVEEKRGLRPEWLPLKDALQMYSEHESLRDISEEKRGSYQREYTALLEYMNCLTEMSVPN